ncbi:MAG: ribosomal protein S6 modification protein [Pseudohongiella sp.]|nr:MAG: ribosomal protein S6 modification protein [Pseudohongiella sp.]
MQQEEQTETVTLKALGWREWVQLPDLVDVPIKAKVDTGAKTSSLHAFFIEPYTKDGKPWVKFLLHPNQNDNDLEVECHAAVSDRRQVSDSGGHKEERYVIESTIVLGKEVLIAELTLTDRDSMSFRMLLGRNLLRGAYTVDSGSSFLMGGTTKRPDLAL